MPVHDLLLPCERPLGTTVLPDGRVRFRTWAPHAERVAVRIGGGDHALAPVGLGVHEGELDAAAGDDYRYVLDDGDPLPDPCTRHQPDGLRGPSRIVDPAAWTWTDAAWRGVALADLVVSELHVGTFTETGTFDAAIEHLAALAQLGVTAVEVMPVADFPGRRGWGYDGVYLWSVHDAYGGPDAMQRFVDAAHAHGLAVILDVVYNHVGASGEQALRAFGPYFTDRYSTFWGEAINYDDADSDAVREWVVQSAETWVRDLHVDGLRLDAIHAIFDTGAVNVLAQLRDRVKAIRPETLVIAESGRNDPQVLRDRAVGGLGHDAAWADDFHHALRVLLTGDTDGYYAEFGAVADLAKAFRVPYVHDGTYSTHRRRRFGAPAADVPPQRHIVFSQDHDQVGNRAFGDRMPRRCRPLAAFATLLSPYTPMLFMGEEYGEDAPFQFFSDHIDEAIATATREGRRREFAAFATFAQEIPDPQDPATFERCKLTRRRDERLAALYAELLALRRTLRGAATEVLGYDERERWLRVRRGEHELVMAFAHEGSTTIPVERERVVLTTAVLPTVEDGVMQLPALSAVVLT